MKKAAHYIGYIHDLGKIMFITLFIFALVFSYVNKDQINSCARHGQYGEQLPACLEFEPKGDSGVQKIFTINKK